MAGSVDATKGEAMESPRDERRTEPTSVLDPRKATILRTVVQEHIVTGQPVGSGHLATSSGLSVSSATIRNEMSVLEREGYLTHPHTSAGRIPTDRGYRYFVDSMTGPARLAEPKQAQVRHFFDRTRADIEQLMSDASRLLADLTDYAAVVVAPPAESVTIRSVQVVDLGSAALVVVVLSNGVVEKATFDVARPVSDAVLNAASARLTTLLASSGVGALTGAVPASGGDGVLDAICQSALDALGAAKRTMESDGRDVFVGGASRVVGSFDTVETIRRVLGTLEEHYVVVNLIRDAMDRPAPNAAHVSIGTEHGTETAFEALLSCSVVVAPYLIDGHTVGTVGVLGPTRMDYGNAMAAVTEVSERLSERLSDS
jgi:heat-inducible transcriptional repressor